MAPLEPWEKVLVDGASYPSTVRGTIASTDCHGGEQAADKETAHNGLLANPSADPETYCGDCHPNTVTMAQNSLHSTLAGYWTVLDARSAPEGHEQLAEAFGNHCASCHATCGECHVSQPNGVGGGLSCQVCHSVDYTSCDGCHVAVSETTGNPFYATDGSYMTFLIGRNVRKSFDRPYDYVPVRHVPISETNFDYYGDNLLPNFNALPTWAYATPHNIQRQTPQNASCDACHGQESLFLTVDKVYPEELEANLPVIVDEIPAPITSTLPITATMSLTSTAPITSTLNVTPTLTSP